MHRYRYRLTLQRHDSQAIARVLCCAAAVYCGFTLTEVGRLPTQSSGLTTIKWDRVRIDLEVVRKDGVLGIAVAAVG